MSAARAAFLFLLALPTRPMADDDERDRGDVPGWVLITLMTAGIVTVLWTFAGPRLLAILTNALNSVSGGGTG